MADFGSHGQLTGKPVVRIPIDTSETQVVLYSQDLTGERGLLLMALVLSVSGAGTIRLMEDDEDLLAWVAKAADPPIVLPRNGDGWAKLHRTKELRLQNPQGLTLRGQLYAVEW